MLLSFWRRPRTHGKKLVQACGLLALGVMGYFVGRYGILSQATAVPPPPGPSNSQVAQPAPMSGASDYSRRAVAYIYGNVMVSREDLGEYLIARQGAEKLALLINKLIIEHACKRKGITVTEAEIDAALTSAMAELGVGTPQAFEEQVLKPRQSSLYEWREDVLRSRIALTKLCRERVQVTEKDLHDAYEAKYGEKIDCRMILFPKGETKQAMQVYDKLRSSEEEFARFARTQAVPSLAANGGHPPRPISRHGTGSPQLENEAFTLREQEVSRIIATPDGDIILKCDRRIPPDANTPLEKVREELQKEVFEVKLTQMFPQVMKELQEEAKPKQFLKKVRTQEEWLNEIRELDAEAARQLGAAASPGQNR